jgi:superfamily I DNA and/or RNA helicase
MIKKEKYLQVFKYLKEFSKIRGVSVKDIEFPNSQYQEIIWLEKNSNISFFECITFPHFNKDADYWIKLSKPKGEPILPKFPKLSDNLNTWIIKESLTDEIDLPTLHPFVKKDGKIIKLEDLPEIEDEFIQYLSNNWIKDLDIYKWELERYEILSKEYEQKSKLYKELFNIYNKLEQFGEEFELVLGVGLLNFKENNDSPKICRHILTAKTTISFETLGNDSFLKVIPSFDDDIQIETDAILDLEKQFNSNDIIEAEKMIRSILSDKSLALNLFDIDLNTALQSFADRIRSDGQYEDKLEKPQQLSQKPTVYFSPALLFRKRNTKSFTDVYEKIITQLSLSQDNLNIPSLNNLIGVIDPKNTSDYQSTIASDFNNFSHNDDTIYFPKKYNDEQIAILEKSKRNNKVLVQGPPGTGKSHTIANLICHLLANGNKILITAQSERALKVLRGQLPEEFRNLAVNLLSSENADKTSEKQGSSSLDASVNAINEMFSSISDLNLFSNEIENLRKELDTLNSEKAFIKNEWLNAKERFTRKQTFNAYYQGTLSEIAESIDSNESNFEWFNDNISELEKLEFIQEIGNFYELTQKYQNQDLSLLGYSIPPENLLPEVSDLQAILNLNQVLEKKKEDILEFIGFSCKDFNEFISELEKLLKTLQTIDGIQNRNKSEIFESFTKNDVYIADKNTRTKEILSEFDLEELKDLDRNIEIKYPQNLSLLQLKNDANTLLEYLKNGNTLSGTRFALNKVFLPKNIKEKLYFIEAVTVNGSPSDTLEELETIVKDIKIKQNIEELERIWGFSFGKISKYYFDKLNHFVNLKNESERLINLYGNANLQKIKILSISSISNFDLNSDTIKNLISNAEYNQLLQEKEHLDQKLNNVRNILYQENRHPITHILIDALNNLDVYKYEQEKIKLMSFLTNKANYENYIELQNKLQTIFPNLVNEILNARFNPANLFNLEKAICFKHAKHELSIFLGANLEKEIELKLSKIELKIEKLISEIGAKKAWYWVIERLYKDPLLMQNLQKWVLAIKKIPKTATAKTASRARKLAQTEMEKCKESIPCWIMPLIKVTETVRPSPGIYDYVIVDEASQLGAEASFLHYIGKKIIVVGDDKQTSPEHIGMDLNILQPYVKKYLSDIHIGEYLDLKYSFFDQAKILCAGTGMIVLREHFRCMPEIIEFCSKHFYAPDGNSLYPLKQYSENRLEPLKTVYCKNGYTSGSSSTIKNQVEADEIANKIAILILDERYDGKTFGVISLQGSTQAKLIDDLILKKIGQEEYKKRNIICGNSASLQGDERDIMFLSLVTAENHNRSSLTKTEDERRFNVAVSRAKEQIWLYHSIQLDDIKNRDDLRFKLLDHFLNYKNEEYWRTDIISVPKAKKETTPPMGFRSWFEVEVYNELVGRGYKTLPNYKVLKGKYEIDLVPVLSNGVKIAIECDGDYWHGPEKAFDDLMRQKILERCGWQFFRIRDSEYYTNRKKSLEPLWEKLLENETNKAEKKKTVFEIEKTNNINWLENIDFEITKKPLKFENVYYVNN